MHKRYALIAMVSTLAFAAGISAALAQSTRGSRKPQKQVSQRPNPIDSEALDSVNKSWARYLTKCGESYFLKAKGNAFYRGTIWEFRSVTVRAEKSELDEADRLNGIEWKGTSTLKAQTGRSFDFRSWSKWDSTPVMFTMDLTKTKGIWSATEPRFNGILLIEFTKPICSETVPRWVTQLRSNPIIAGVGLAGIQLGYAESKVVELLGEPTKRYQESSVDGQILDYALDYDFDGLSIHIRTSTDQRLVNVISLSDEGFNQGHQIPNTAQGATIGDTVVNLRRRFGEPTWTDEHYTCPEILGHGRAATTYYYPGISFWGCHANGLVYVIIIMR